MGFFSILPENLGFIELWTARIFLLLGLITIGPWAALIIYDFCLYVFRTITYEVPFVGGRARGRQRPRAPSLTERPSGHRRKFSLNPSASPIGRRLSTGTSKTTGIDERPESTMRHSEPPPSVAG